MERVFPQNLHSHTKRCKHAKGIPMDYAKAAGATKFAIAAELEAKK